MARRAGSATGSARRIRLFTSEKIAVLAPMPSASESTATIETIGVARRARTARRKSLIALSSLFQGRTSTLPAAIRQSERADSRGVARRALPDVIADVPDRAVVGRIDGRLRVVFPAHHVLRILSFDEHCL